MNTKLVESLIQLIRSLPEDERFLLEQQLFFDASYPSTRDIMELTQKSGSLNFLNDEPDLYRLEDGEPV